MPQFLEIFGGYGFVIFHSTNPGDWSSGLALKHKSVKNLNNYFMRNFFIFPRDSNKIQQAASFDTSQEGKRKNVSFIIYLSTMNNGRNV